MPGRVVPTLCKITTSPTGCATVCQHSAVQWYDGAHRRGGVALLADSALRVHHSPGSWHGRLVSVALPPEELW